MSVCLALAVIYSFGYPGSTPLTSGAGATGTVLAQGTGSLVDATIPATGFVGEQQLVAPETTTTPFGTTDSLVPGREVPGTQESARATANADKAPAESPSTMERPAKGSLISPLQFLTPSSPFGLRTSPITGQHDEFHSGQDFAAPCGTRVFSADAGVVRAAGWHPWGGGNRVELDHGNGLVTTYNHLEGIAVEAGDRVGAGQVIATVGTTGWSTGCHLHFETILNGSHTDPSAWKLISLDGGGPIEMPSLVNFTPGTGNGDDDETAWVAYLASSEPIHPVAFKSPARVDAEVSALGKRSTGKPSSSTEKTSSVSTATSTQSPATSNTPSTTPTPPASTSPKPTPPATTSPTPKPPATTTPKPTSPVTVDPTPTPPATVDPDPTPVDPTPIVPDPTPIIPDPSPVVPDPTPIVPDPTPIVPDPTPVVPDPTPIVPDPTPIVPDPTPVLPDPTPVVPDPTPDVPHPKPIVPDPTPIVPDPTAAVSPALPTVSVADPLAACDPAVDPDAVVVHPLTGEPVLDPVTGEPIRAAELCASAATSQAPGAAGTEPAREPDPALTTAP